MITVFKNRSYNSVVEHITTLFDDKQLLTGYDPEALRSFSPKSCQLHLYTQQEGIEGGESN